MMSEENTYKITLDEQKKKKKRVELDNLLFGNLYKWRNGSTTKQQFKKRYTTIEILKKKQKKNDELRFNPYTWCRKFVFDIKLEKNRV